MQLPARTPSNCVGAAGVYRTVHLRSRVVGGLCRDACGTRL